MLKCLNMDKIENGIVILSVLLIKCQKYVGKDHVRNGKKYVK